VRSGSLLARRSRRCLPVARPRRCAAVRVARRATRSRPAVNRLRSFSRRGSRLIAGGIGLSFVARGWGAHWRGATFGVSVVSFPRPTVSCAGNVASARSVSRVLRFAPDLASRGYALDTSLASAWGSSQATFGPRKGSLMSLRSFAPRHPRPSAAALQALDFGLQVHLDGHSSQRSIFFGAESLSVRQLTSELSELVSGLRVHSFSLRAQLEEVTSAIMVNLDCGFWSLAGRASLDL